MKTVMRIEKPGLVEVSLTITMPLTDWQRLREQLSNDYPSWGLAQEIGDVVSQLERKVFKLEKPD
jgi:hypothetical protein